MSDENQIEIKIDNTYKLNTEIGGRPKGMDQIDYNIPYYKINGLDQKSHVYKRLLFLPIKMENTKIGNEKISASFKLSDNILFENLTETDKQKIDGLLQNSTPIDDNDINKIEKNKDPRKPSTTINGHIPDSKPMPASSICKYTEGSSIIYYFFMIYFETDNKQFTADQLFKTGINKNFKLYYNFVIQLKNNKINDIQKDKSIEFKINKKEEIKVNKVDQSDYGVYLPIIEVIKKGKQKEKQKEEKEKKQKGEEEEEEEEEEVEEEEEGNEKKMFFVLGKSNYLYDYQNYDPPRIVGKINKINPENPEFLFNEEYRKFFNN